MPTTVLHVMETSDLVHETRMRKQATVVLSNGLADRVVLAGRLLPGQPRWEQVAANFEFVRIPMLRGSRYRILTPFRRWDAGRRLVQAARDIRPAMVDCHHLCTLEWCVKMKRALGIPLVYVPHELETERNGLRGLRQKLDRWAERRFIRECDAVVVVCDSIADWYAKQYGIARPVVVRNVPEVKGERPAPNPRLWRERFNIPDDHVIFIYQGGLFRGRRIEQLLRVFARAKPDRHVVFMGYGERQSTVEDAARQHANIHYAPAVKPDEVLLHTAGADVGLVGVANVCLSYYFSLPNKLFEFMLAGIPALMPAYPEMVRATAGSGSGWVVGENDEDWLAAINGLTLEQVAAGKRAAHVAGGRLSWQDEAAKLTAVYRRVQAISPLPSRITTDSLS